MNIDFVIPWVDGSDPDWIAQRNRYCQSAEDSDASRYRNWDTLRYWFRSVEQHAPWVHRIYFITCGQLPHWLNREHPKLRLVDHRDYIPSRFLPTFSSHTIELNLHRIPELSEHFVYFNDDMFLNADVSADDFFREGLPRDCAILDNAAPLHEQDAYSYAQRNVIATLNSHFQMHHVLKENLSGWFHPAYGKYLLKNLYGAAPKAFSGIKNFHIPSSMLKSTYNNVWELEPALLEQTCQNRFRNTKDVNQYIMSYFQLCSGHFIPRSTAFGKCHGIQRENKKMYKDLLTGKHKVICINDHPYITDFETEKAKLIAAFDAKYPKKSSYEID